MPIPLSKLVNVYNLFQKAFKNEPFDKQVYDMTVEFGDRIERGLPVNGEVVDPKAIQSIRNVCWEAITEVLIYAEAIGAHDFAKKGNFDPDSVRDFAERAPFIMAVNTLKQLGVEPTQANINEVLAEFARRKDDPSHDELKKQIERELI